MKKLVRGLNVNTAVAFAFTALALLYSLGRLIFLFAAFGYYDTQYVILNSLCALTLGASELLFCMGVVNKNKTRKLLLWSAITAGSAIVLYSLYILLDYSKVISAYNTFISVLAAAQVAFSSNYLGVLFALSISIAAAVLMSLYVGGKLKNKILVKSFLVAGWFLCLFQMICYKMEGGLFLISVLILFAAYLLLLSSNDIFSADTEVSIPEVVLLSIVTFGVYFIIWMASIVK
ncbi:MAG: hypothetical protein Q8882_07895, partial [Bacillota bacterium]|nr:hypothetical protein [Bacillota bacterium]